MTHTPTLSRRLEIYARMARGRSLFQILTPTALSGIFTVQLMRVGVTTVILNSNSHAHTVWQIISRTQSSITQYPIDRRCREVQPL